MSLEVSQLMDGEMDEGASQRAFAALRDDAQARAAWERYHVIGDALRGTTEPALHSQRLQARVFAALAQEPTVLAPAPALKRGAAPARNWMRVSVAAAASFAAFGLFTWLAPTQPDSAQVAVADKPRAGVESLQVAAPSATQLATTVAAEGVAEDPYLEAHFEVSVARPGVIRASFQSDGAR
jgi:sigma-E factor negative regulatory protein RseA